MKAIKYLIFLIVLLAFISSCRDQYFPDTPENAQQYVIEGFIEARENPLPAYVIVTQSFPFFDSITTTTFEDSFVKGASVQVNDGDKNVQLSEVCLSNLPDQFKGIIADFLGLEVDSVTTDLCIYVDLFYELSYETGRSYDLDIMINNEHITATTTIPEFIPLQGFRWAEPTDIENDSMVQLWAEIVDPPTTDFYRYKTATLGRELTPPPFSVVNDLFFDDSEFEFPLDRAMYFDEEFDVNTIGLYTRGDSITIHWMVIDEAQFEFWNTLEFNEANQGPFSSYTRVNYNIEGGIGIWGGNAISVYEMVVPE